MRLYATILCLMLTLSGCTTLGLNTSGTSDTGPAASQYYDFDDVQIPAELELNADKSFVLETPTMKSGVMAFSGKVTRLSLTNYFINNMALDNWSMRSAFKSIRSLLLFEKPNRYCVISITDTQFKTLCEIWVLPKQGGTPLPDQTDPNADSTAITPTTGTIQASPLEIPVEERPFPISQ